MTEARDPLTEQIIGCAIKVHRALGPGLLESAYEACLAFELNRSGLVVATQVPLPLIYEDVRLDCGYRIDLIVSDDVIVEVKSIERLLPLHEAQLLTYMRLARKRRGLLMNFNAEVLFKQVVRRVL